MNEEKEPEFGKSNLGPKWWHPHGIKMVLRERKKRGPLIIESGIARLEISKNSGGGCIATWKITHDMLSRVNGTVFMTEKEFKRAFDTSDAADLSPGVFIRYKEWLNMPCPGTGLNGDPNISLKITEEIKKEARSLIDGN